MNFAECLKKLLEERKLRQADICRLTGIQTSLMSDYLRSKKSPTIANAILIADALEVSLDILVGKDTHNSNKAWLRAGEGNMRIETTNDIISDLTKQYDLDELDQKIIMEYAKLSAVQKDAIKNYIGNVLQLDEISATTQEKQEESTECDNGVDIEKEVALYRQVLEEEKNMKMSAASQNSSLQKEKRRIS